MFGPSLGAQSGSGTLVISFQPSAQAGPFFSSCSPSFAATERLHQRFGDEAVYVLVREPVTQLTLTSDILRVQGLEGCISGNAPKGAVPPGGRNGPCAQLAASKPAKVVFGPGTFLNEAVGQIQDQFKAESTARAAQAKRAAALGNDPITTERLQKLVKDLEDQLRFPQ